MERRAANDPSDPWSFDYFAPATHAPNKSGDVPLPKLPSPPKTPRDIPGVQELFTVQKDLVRAIECSRYVDPHMRKNRDWHELDKQLQNAYRVLNRYLREYASQEIGLG